MAIYEYVCSRCSHEFEVMKPMSQASELARCPKCRAPAMKQVSAFSSKDGFYLKSSSPTPLRKKAAGARRKGTSGK